MPQAERDPKCSLQPETWRAASSLWSFLSVEASDVPGVMAPVNAGDHALWHVTTIAEYVYIAHSRVFGSLLCALLCKPLHLLAASVSCAIL